VVHARQSIRNDLLQDVIQRDNSHHLHRDFFTSGCDKSLICLALPLRLDETQKSRGACQ
jgi:hypothetical protein